MSDLPATYHQVDFKIKLALIPSAAITKLATFPHGSGGLGDVWKCSMSTPSGTRPVAVKSIRVHRLNDSELLRKAGRMIRREAYVWTQLSHDHILPLEGITDDFSLLPALVSLWMKNGTLNDLLKREFSQLTDRRKLELIRQIAAGLSYLHREYVVHGDLIPNNILVDDSGNLRLADFGLSMFVPESGNSGFLQAGITRWIAPEFVAYANDSEELQSSLKPTKAGDIYSFGCVMLQIFSGKEPYSRIRTMAQVISGMTVGENPFRGVDINMDEAYRQLSLRCLSMTPIRRPSIIEITTILDPVNMLVAPEAMLQDLTKFITKIGEYPVARGGFGDIWKCVYKTELGSTKVAVKSLLVYASDEDGEAMKRMSKRIRHELKICAGVTHSNILPVLGHASGFGPFMAIVSPWAENGNLTAYLEREDANVHVVRRFHMLRDIAAGLQHLHTHYIIHGDLTGLNVLIHGDGSACITDFGLSLMYSEVVGITQASWTSTFHGNPRWLAPELLGEPEDDVPVRPRKWSDIYSFGNIMLNVLTSKVPYYYLREAAASQCICTGKKPNRLRYPAFSNDYWHFIEECWSDAPGDRPSAERVVEVIKDELDSLSSSSAT